MVKFTADTYPGVPVSNCESCAKAIKHLWDWANSNNLHLNHFTEMPTCCSDPNAGGANNSKSWGNQDTASDNQQEFLGDAARLVKSLFALHTFQHHACRQMLYTLFSKSLFALHTFQYHDCRQMLYTLFSKPQSSLGCHTRRLHGGNSPWLLIIYKLFSGGCQLSASVRPLLERLSPSVQTPLTNCVHIKIEGVVIIKISSSYLTHGRDAPYMFRPHSHDFTLSIRTTSLGDNNYISQMLYWLLVTGLLTILSENIADNQ